MSESKQLSGSAQVTKSRTGRRDGSGGVQSVDRAITLLEILAREGSAGVSEMAAEIGVHKSTAFRLLAALESRGMVEQNSDRGKYELGFGVLRLANAIPARLSLVAQSQGVVTELAEILDETVNLAVLREHYSVHIQQALGSSAIASQNWVGQLTALHATSTGKVLLAYLPDEQRDRILDVAGLPALTKQTVTSPESFNKELAEVRKDGFATAFEELEVGLNAAAVPVRDHTGLVIAALSASGPAFRFDRAQVAAALDELKAAGLRLSELMGWRELKS